MPELVFKEEDLLAVGGPCQRAQTLHPGSGHQHPPLHQRFHLAAAKVQQLQLVQFARVAQPGELAVIRRKDRLKNGNILISIEQLHLAEGAHFRVKGSQEELCAIPGHIRVIPLHPGEQLAIGAHRWLHVKIRALLEDPGPLAAIQRGDGDHVFVFVSVDENDKALIRRDHRRGAGSECWGDRARQSFRVRLVVEPPVAFGKGRSLPPGKEISAAVADPAGGVEIAAEVKSRVARGLGKQAGLAVQRLRPKQEIVVRGPLHIVQADAPCQHGGRDRGGPETVGESLFRHSSPRLLNVCLIIPVSEGYSTSFRRAASALKAFVLQISNLTPKIS